MIKYLVVNNAFNRHWYPNDVGRIYTNPPAYRRITSFYCPDYMSMGNRLVLGEEYTTTPSYALEHFRCAVSLIVNSDNPAEMLVELQGEF